MIVIAVSGGPFGLTGWNCRGVVGEINGAIQGADAAGGGTGAIGDLGNAIIAHAARASARRGAGNAILEIADEHELVGAIVVVGSHDFVDLPAREGLGAVVVVELQRVAGAAELVIGAILAPDVEAGFACAATGHLLNTQMGNMLCLVEIAGDVGNQAVTDIGSLSLALRSERPA